MTWRSPVRLTIFVLSIVGMTAALWVLLTKAAHGEFRAGTAGGLIFLYASTVIALVLSAAAAIKTLRHRLVFHVVLAALTAMLAGWWFTNIHFDGSAELAVFAVIGIGVTLVADAVSGL